MLKHDGGKKADRRTLTNETFIAFHLEQVKKGLAVHATPEKTTGAVSGQKGKGKGKRARNSPDPGEPEASGSAPSPSAPLASLGEMTLESGQSSAADTASDNPAAIRPLVELSTPGSSTLCVRIPGGLGRSTKPTQKSATFAVEVPATSKYLHTNSRRTLSSHTDTSLPSDDGSNSGRYTALERRVAEVEKLVLGMDSRLKKLGG